MVAMVGHILHARQGVPYLYCGRGMPWHRGPKGEALKDAGFGNVFRLGKNSDDPVMDYWRLLEGQMGPKWEPKRQWLLAALPHTIGCDLLCWCHKEPVVWTPDMDNWKCHGEVQLDWRHRWAVAHPDEARAIAAKQIAGRS